MEELQTTEILDREILEDARKKAYKILKTADETVKTNVAEWAKKTNATLEGLNKKYAEQREFSRAEIMARLPMDKRRAKAEKIESLIRSAIETWYAGLGSDRVLALLRKELQKRLAEYGDFSGSGEKPGAKPRALLRKLDRAEAEAMLKAILPDCAFIIEEMPSADIYPAIILENSMVRITASLYKTVDFFLHEKREELTGALLGAETLDSVGGEGLW